MKEIKFNAQNVQSLITYIVESEKMRNLLMCPPDINPMECDRTIPCSICTAEYYHKMEGELWNFITSPQESCDRY